MYEQNLTLSSQLWGVVSFIHTDPFPVCPFLQYFLDKWAFSDKAENGIGVFSYRKVYILMKCEVSARMNNIIINLSLQNSKNYIFRHYSHSYFSKSNNYLGNQNHSRCCHAWNGVLINLTLRMWQHAKQVETPAPP